MHDSIDILETIGQDSNLRYSSGDELASTLALAKASDALKSAILREDRTELSKEFGSRVMQLNQGNLSPRREDEPDHEEGDEPEDPNRPSGPDGL